VGFISLFPARGLLAACSKQSGAPISVVLTGANRHDKVAAIDMIVSMSVKRPAHKEQHLCAETKPTMPQR
jgi:hypothetical protein